MINVAPIQVTDPITTTTTVVAPLQATLNIAGIIQDTSSAGLTVNSTGAGLLQLSGQNTFGGGVAVSNGGLILGASSTPTTGTSASVAVTSGPVGTGTLTMAGGTSLLASAAATLLNPLTVQGNLTFSSGSSLTFNGALTASRTRLIPSMSPTRR